MTPYRSVVGEPPNYRARHKSTRVHGPITFVQLITSLEIFTHVAPPLFNKRREQERDPFLLHLVHLLYPFMLIGTTIIEAAKAYVFLASKQNLLCHCSDPLVLLLWYQRPCFHGRTIDLLPVLFGTLC